jgi:hypothetical protein
MVFRKLNFDSLRIGIERIVVAERAFTDGCVSVVLGKKKFLLAGVFRRRTFEICDALFEFLKVKFFNTTASSFVIQKR